MLDVDPASCLTVERRGRVGNIGKAKEAAWAPRSAPLMTPDEEMKSALGEAVNSAEPGLVAADVLCQSCVALLGVDGAAISLIHDGKTQGTFGSSGPASRHLDELQYTFGEGPCLDAVRDSGSVFVADLEDDHDQRWPAYGPAVLGLGVRAVFALPVMVASSYVGVLDLFRNAPGPLAGDQLSGALLAAELAALPVLDLMTADVDWTALADFDDSWSQLASLERVEVYQATGMIMAQLDIGPAEALVRLRARAFAHGVTASELAWQVVEGRLSLRGDRSWRIPPLDGGTAA